MKIRLILFILFSIQMFILNIGMLIGYLRVKHFEIGINSITTVLSPIHLFQCFVGAISLSLIVFLLIKKPFDSLNNFLKLMGFTFIASLVVGVFFPISFLKFQYGDNYLLNDIRMLWWVLVLIIYEVATWFTLFKMKRDTRVT